MILNNKKMELYYKNGVSEYQHQIGGIRKTLVYKKKAIDFIKNYCSDYFSMTVNIAAIIIMII